MKLAWAAAVAVLALAGCSRPATDDADLVVLAGQSNAVGYGLTTADLPAGPPDSDVLIWQGDRFAPLRPGTNTGSLRQPSTWGPEVGFARAWREAHPGRRLYLVKHARGSTPLAPAAGPDWSAGSGELFAEATTKVEAAKAALAAQDLKPRLVGVLWIQGEADAGDAAMAGAYRANLTRLIKAMRLGWSAPGAVVVVAKIPDWGGRADEVRAAQAQVDEADTLTVSVDAQGLPMQDDGLHLAAEGQLRLGKAMAVALTAATR
jgi:hypothetical protein